jgi:predicted transcriptional regulator
MGPSLLRLAEYDIKVPVGIEEFPELYSVEGTHMAAKQIETQIRTEIADTHSTKLQSLAELPRRIGLIEPIITSTEFNLKLRELFGNIMNYSHIQCGNVIHYASIQWMPFRIEYTPTGTHTAGAGCENMSYTTGHILVFAAVTHKQPLQIRKLSNHAAILNLKASNGLTPIDMLSCIITSTLANNLQEFMPVRQALESVRAELAQILRDQKPAWQTLKNKLAEIDNLSDSESEDNSRVFGIARPTMVEPPEYKDE